MNIFYKMMGAAMLVELAQKEVEREKKNAELKSKSPRRYRMIWLLKICFLVIVLALGSWIATK